ncbi:MAG: hypothetical protein ACTSSA_12615 [Candidatus Freyarchaeota archaeon]
MDELARLHQMYDTVAEAYKKAAEMPADNRRKRRERLKNLRRWKHRLDWLDKKLAEQGEK